MQSIQKMLQHKAGKIAGCLTGVLLIAIAVYTIHSVLGKTDAEAAAADRLFICSDTGKSFSHELVRGDTLPVQSPYSGANTGYPAELCYWTAEGQIRKDATPVLLNNYLGKREPTFCPECGRLVVGHNPVPHAGSKPPPTHEQYARAHPRGAMEARLDNGR